MRAVVMVDGLMVDCFGVMVVRHKCRGDEAGQRA